MLMENKYRPGLILLSLLVVFFLLPGSSGAQEKGAIGKIIALRGQAQVTATVGNSRQLEIGSEIAVADVVTTGRRCRLQIMFADSSIVSLGPASEFVVKEYAWNAETQQGKMNSRINEGVFRVLGGSITKTSPQNFTTETPSATIGIRGSMYAGRVRDGALQVVFQGGKGIYVRNPLGSVDISTPGFGTRLSEPGQPPEEPHQFSPQELELLDPVVATAPPLADPASSGEATDESLGSNAVAAPEPSEEPLETVGSAEELALPPGPPAEPLPVIGDIPIAVDSPAQATTSETLLPSGGTASVSGLFTAVQDDLVLTSNIDDLTWVGNLSGQTSANYLTSTATTNNGTFAITSFPVPGYDPALAYTGSSKQQNLTRTVDLLGNPVTFGTAEVITDNTGEFSVFLLKDTFSPGYLYSELGFLGTPTLVLPSTGLSQFSGPMVGTLTNLGPTEFETMGYLFHLGVNWHNGKVFGAVISGPPDEANGFFFGDISGTGLTISNFFGNDIVDMGPGPILAISGSSSFGQFYGNQASGVGFAASGNTHNVLTQSPEESWQFTAGGFRDPGIGTSSTGTVNWKGYVVGVGEDMNNIDVDRRLFMNSVSGDFSLSIDRDSGNINGTLSAMDLIAAVSINALTIGGSNGSAYLDDHILAAGLDGAAAIVNGSSGPLKNQGNYLMTEDPSSQFASYASWGTWEIAYVDPNTTANYHVHMPGAYWVAGELTSPANFAALNFPATYSCNAEGAYVPQTGQFYNLPTGAVTLDVNFATNSLDSGSIVFPMGTNTPALNFALNPTSISATGFNATFSTPSGSLNGAFYGPAAESAAGNFEGQVGVDRFIGVFGGDR